MKKTEVADIAKLVIATRSRDHSFFLPFEIEEKFHIKKAAIINSLNVLRDMNAFDYTEVPWNPQDEDQWDEISKTTGIPKPRTPLEDNHHLNEVGIMFISSAVLDAMNNHTKIPEIGKTMDLKLLKKVVASPEIIPDRLMQKYFATPDARVKSILFVEREPGRSGAVIVNESYDNPIKVNATKGRWKMLYDIARKEFVDEEYDNGKARSYVDYFNTHRRNPLYTRSHCQLTPILGIHGSIVEPVIEQVTCISEKALKQRQNKKLST